MNSIRFRITDEEKAKFWMICKAKAINPSLLLRQMVANFIKKTEEENNKDG
jgi:hypothetical protein